MRPGRPRPEYFWPLAGRLPRSSSRVSGSISPDRRAVVADDLMIAQRVLSASLLVINWPRLVTASAHRYGTRLSSRELVGPMGRGGPNSLKTGIGPRAILRGGYETLIGTSATDRYGQHDAPLDAAWCRGILLLFLVRDSVRFAGPTTHL